MDENKGRRGEGSGLKVKVVGENYQEKISEKFQKSFRKKLRKTFKKNYRKKLENMFVKKIRKNYAKQKVEAHWLNIIIVEPLVLTLFIFKERS